MTMFRKAARYVRLANPVAVLVMAASVVAGIVAAMLMAPHL